MAIFEKMEKEKITRLEVLPDDPGIEEASWVSVQMKEEGHEKVNLFNYPGIPNKGGGAIHSTVLGDDCIGGIRYKRYDNEKEMIWDLLRLSKNMSLKSSISGLDRGGAKCTVWRTDETKKDRPFFESLAKEINAFCGVYRPAEDIGINTNDLMFMHSNHLTRHVGGLPHTYRFYRDGKLCYGGGDPGSMTAEGLALGMAVCVKYCNLGKENEITLVIQGVGNVGKPFASIAYQNGFRNFKIADTDADAAGKFKLDLLRETIYEARVEIVDPEKIYDAVGEIFVPCAIGGVLTEDTVIRLKKAGCKIVAGSANNPLATPEIGHLLMSQGILYAPDYVINAGGLINVDDELNPNGYNRNRVRTRIESTIPRNIALILYLSKKLKKPTSDMADILAWLRIKLKRDRDLMLSKTLGLSEVKTAKLFNDSEEAIKKMLTA
jgi:leucine dehydrogenase